MFQQKIFANLVLEENDDEVAKDAAGYNGNFFRNLELQNNLKKFLKEILYCCLEITKANCRN